jgi:hypothetical protein
LTFTMPSRAVTCTLVVEEATPGLVFSLWYESFGHGLHLAKQDKKGVRKID